MDFDKKGLTFQRRQTVGPKIISIRHQETDTMDEKQKENMQCDTAKIL